MSNIKRTSSFENISTKELVKKNIVKVYKSDIDKDVYFSRLEMEIERELKEVYVHFNNIYMSIEDYFGKDYFDYNQLVKILVSIDEMIEDSDLYGSLGTSFEKVLRFRDYIFMSDGNLVLKFNKDTQDLVDSELVDI